jgi:hypothetical protein
LIVYKEMFEEDSRCKLLLNLFADDYVIYEPISRRYISYNKDGRRIKCLKGRSEIESFFNVVMMASDGFKYVIKFIDELMDIDYEQPKDTVDSTPSSIVSALVTFYRNQES